MINKINDFVRKYHMFDADDTVIVGLSGGADSVCLIRVLQSLRESYGIPHEIIGVHVNHQIRGDEAMRDETFSQNLCKDLGIRYECHTVNVPKIAEELNLSEEEAGRKMRYQIFTQIASEIENGHAVIAVAHHRNDQAETVMMNLLRGSGLRGVSGMQPVRDQNGVQIVRPLLCVSRQEIEQYLQSIDQRFITDSTNLDTEYTRNKIRNELIPYLQDQFNPNVIGAICDMAENLSQAEVYIEKHAVTLYKSAVTYATDPDTKKKVAMLCVDELKNADPLLVSYVIRRTMTQLAQAQKDIYRNHVEQVAALINQQVGKQVSLPYGLTARRTYDKIQIGFTNQNRDLSQEDSEEFNIEITKKQLDDLAEGQSIIISINKFVSLGENKDKFIKNIIIEKAKMLENSLNNVYTKYFDYDKMKSNIYLRFRKTGDSIVTQTNGASRKLKKEFIDRKIPKEDRDNILLLADKEHILWAIGIRRSEDYRIDSGSNSILKISVELQEE